MGSLRKTSLNCVKMLEALQSAVGFDTVKHPNIAWFPNFDPKLLKF